MDRNDIMNLIGSLACSQGFYGRLYNDIMDMDEFDRDTMFAELEAMNFKDSIDFIMWLES